MCPNPNNNEAAFRALVKDMRDAQKDYFRTRSQDALRRSKALERRVDSELAKAASRQASLFDTPDNFKNH